ncbi:glutamine amidotransferase [Brachyspira hyodysenteriae]|nr:glutamine amidotransferase [Brachyspira hyodysenteriae]
MDGKGHWKNTAVEKLLPIDFEVFDDREECPEGVNPVGSGFKSPNIKRNRY